MIKFRLVNPVWDTYSKRDVGYEDTLGSPNQYDAKTGELRICGGHGIYAHASKDDYIILNDDKMTNTEIKKALYKQKPTAQLEFIRKGVAYYHTQLSDGDLIRFQIPVDDMGDADFFTEMEAKFLIRWIQD